MTKTGSKNKVPQCTPYIHVDISTLKTELDNKVEHCKNLSVNWLMYTENGAFTGVDLQNLSKFEDLNVKKKIEMFKANPNELSLLFVRFISVVYNNDVVQHVLALFEEIFIDNREVINLFYNQVNQSEYDVIEILMSMTNRENPVIVYLTRRIISRLIGSQKFVFKDAQASLYLKMFITDLKMPKNLYLRDCLQMAKRFFLVSHLRILFVKIGGLPFLVEVVSNTKQFCIQYDGIFTLWLLSFNQPITDKLVDLKVLEIVAHILRETTKSKVIRISLSLYCNIMSKATNQKMVITQLLGVKIGDVIKTIDNTPMDDEDMKNDFAFVRKYVEAGIEDLTNFDEYLAEIKSGNLEWSPTHKSERFWKENVMRFCDNNYEVLKILIDIATNDTNVQNIAIALHDIGEFVRHYQRGRLTVERLGGKAIMMSCLNHENSSIRYEALIAIQKFLVDNWEFLGRHLDARISMLPLGSKNCKSSLLDD